MGSNPDVAVKDLPHCTDDAEFPVRRIAGGDVSALIDKEWLVTNGLGGYAAGTVAGAATRRYHGLLVAAHPAPLGRVMMLNHLVENFRLPDFRSVAVGGTVRSGGDLDIRGADVLQEFRLELGLPVWEFHIDGHRIEKRLYLPYRRNTVHLRYRLLDGPGPVRLKLRPAVHFRGHDDYVSTPNTMPYTLTAVNGKYELSGGLTGFPKLRLKVDGDSAALTLDGQNTPDILYRIEESRGYDGVGTQYSPGVFRANLTSGQEVYLTASTEAWDRMILPPDVAFTSEVERRKRLLAAAQPAACRGFGAELVLAADQFLITPASRVEESARAEAVGDEARTVIAGYHWFTDWGRDTMISLEGLTLTTGRYREAGYILRTFASHVKDGLIPNYFPDRGTEGLYHTADASLWFFHAVERYVTATGDRDTLRKLLPTLQDIVAHHRNGTRFGIGVDPADGLLRQGAEGYQLTWMDAKVGDWVVTPRRGKAVEINALWYNALRLLEGWLKEEDEPGADETGAAAHRVYESFNRRFWRADANACFDVIDGPDGQHDPADRPNVLFAVALTHPVLSADRWKPVVDRARERLLTPVGLRSLAPGHPDYKPAYFGDLRNRDAAYHQGTVWGWLIGPFLDAEAKAYPDRRGSAAEIFRGFERHLSEACVGTISEVFDATEPYTARGCAAQAWSVAEVLRRWAAGG